MRNDAFDYSSSLSSFKIKCQLVECNSSQKQETDQILSNDYSSKQGKSASKLSVEIITETDPEVITCGGLGFINSSSVENSSSEEQRQASNTE